MDDQFQKNAAFRVARAALAASGAVTLELALAGIPTVAAYRLTAWEAFILRRLVRVPSIALPNLVIGENVVPEYLQEDCAPEGLAQALISLLSDTPERRKQIEAFARLDAIMEIGTVRPSERAQRESSRGRACGSDPEPCRWRLRVIFGNDDAHPPSAVRLRKQKDQRVRFTASRTSLRHANPILRLLSTQG